MAGRFTYDARLGISLPVMDQDWEEYAKEEQEQILFEWEMTRGRIPDRIKELEEIIDRKQTSLTDEDNFTVTCRLNEDIAELASIINDLWLWFRLDQTVMKRHT
ncbi:MAG: hypothetical protein ACI4XL_14025 [Bacillus sp. (in: firmicutes)]